MYTVSLHVVHEVEGRCEALSRGMVHGG